jgi:hypothetical protein
VLKVFFGIASVALALMVGNAKAADLPRRGAYHHAHYAHHSRHHAYHGDCSWNHHCLRDCPAGYFCYPLYGAYGLNGGVGFWGAYTEAGWGRY